MSAGVMELGGSDWRRTVVVERIVHDRVRVVRRVLHLLRNRSPVVASATSSERRESNQVLLDSRPTPPTLAHTHPSLFIQHGQDQFASRRLAVQGRAAPVQGTSFSATATARR